MALDLRLIKFRQELKEVASTAAYDMVRFSGVGPILIKKDTEFTVVVQSGSAIAWGAVFLPPAAYSGGTLIGQPEINIRKLSFRQWETTWSYAMACSSSPPLADKVAASKYPTTLSFGSV